jgi:exopolysaccharide production protein ExoQ
MLMAAIAALGGISILLCCWRRYELAIILILVSPWVSWLLNSNAAKTVGEEDAVGAASYIRILLVLLVGCCGALQFIRYYFKGYVKLPKYLLIFGAFIFFAIFSGLYSIDRRFTLIRSVEFMFFFMFLLGLHVWFSERKKIDIVFNIYFWVVTCGILLNAAALVLLRDRAWNWIMPDRFEGFTDHPNMFGALCMLAYPILVWKYVTSQRMTKSATAALIIVTLGLHVLSGSRSSLMAAILGGMVWIFYLVRTITLKRIAICLTFGLTLTFSVSFLILTKPASLKRSDAGITALTGRTEFWKGCLLLIKERPIQGYGYGVAGKVWQDPRFQREGEFLWAGSAKSSLHNGYLSLAIGLGLVGFLMWLLILSIPIRQVLSLETSHYKAFILAMVFQQLVLNFFESALSSGSQIYTSLVFWFFLIVAGRLPLLLGQSFHSKSIAKTYMETDFERINSTKMPSGLCAGYTGA